MADLIDISGVSETRADNLRDEGFTSVDDVATADASDLEDVHGVGESTAYDLIDSAQEVITAEHSVDEEADDEPAQEPTDEPDLEDLEEIEEEDDEPKEEEPEAEEEPDREEVTEEDVQELVEEAQEDEPEEEEDEEPEAEEDVEEDSGPYSVSLDVETDEQYDYLMKALIEMKLERSNNAADAGHSAQLVLDATRPLGGAGTVEVELEDVQLNHLHAAVQQAESRHQRSRETDAFEALRDVKRQVDKEREEHLF